MSQQKKHLDVGPALKFLFVNSKEQIGILRVGTIKLLHSLSASVERQWNQWIDLRGSVAQCIQATNLPEPFGLDLQSKTLLLIELEKLLKHPKSEKKNTKQNKTKRQNTAESCLSRPWATLEWKLCPSVAPPLAPKDSLPPEVAGGVRSRGQGQAVVSTMLCTKKKLISTDTTSKLHVSPASRFYPTFREYGHFQPYILSGLSRMTRVSFQLEMDRSALRRTRSKGEVKPGVLTSRLTPQHSGRL